ncbi:MAG: hypothetical protein HY810_00250 [Candidatus Omnitrophica bacterium]|nr:hypothetical protein [Candidatus Omnitrophota bacterium]
MSVLNAKLSFAFLCDYASVSREGKLSLNGIFENINARAFPVHHPLMYIVANIIGVNDKDKFTCELTLESDPGNKLAVIAQEVTINQNRNFGFIGQFINIRYDVQGKYAVKFYIDNKEIGTHCFYLRQN